jgi:hypothetical protein
MACRAVARSAAANEGWRQGSESDGKCPYFEVKSTLFSALFQPTPALFLLTVFNSFTEDFTEGFWGSYSVKNGPAFQISLAYSTMVRLLENLPDTARFALVPASLELTTGFPGAFRE